MRKTLPRPYEQLLLGREAQAPLSLQLGLQELPPSGSGSAETALAPTISQPQREELTFSRPRTELLAGPRQITLVVGIFCLQSSCKSSSCFPGPALPITACMEKSTMPKHTVKVSVPLAFYVKAPCLLNYQVIINTTPGPCNQLLNQH